MSKSYLPIPKRCRLWFFISRELFLISSCLLGQPRENREGGRGEALLSPAPASILSRLIIPVTLFPLFSLIFPFSISTVSFLLLLVFYFFIVYSFIWLHVFFVLLLFHYTLSSLLMKSIMSFNSKSLVSYVVVLVLFY